MADLSKITALTPHEHMGEALANEACRGWLIPAAVFSNIVKLSTQAIADAEARGAARAVEPWRAKVLAWFDLLRIASVYAQQAGDELSSQRYSETLAEAQDSFAALLKESEKP